MGITAHIATIPRSGTWLCRYFFRVLHDLTVYGRAPSVQEMYTGVAGTYEPDYSGIGIGKFRIDHFPYPDDSALNGLALWDSVLANPFIGQFYAEASALLRPHLNGRFVFVYRDPLEHYLSLRLHWQREGLRAAWRQRMVCAAVPFETDWLTTLTPEAYLTSGLLDAYIMQAAPFRLTKSSNILCIPFEALEKAPLQTFTAVVDHIGIATKPQHIGDAVALTSKQKMKEYEKQLGHGLSKPIDSPVGQSHLADARPSPAWFPYETEGRIRERLAAFGL